LLEHLLRIDHYARMMGPVTPLPAADREKLLAKRASLGLGPGNVAVKSRPDEKIVSQAPFGDNELLKNLIAEELRKILVEKK